MALLSAVAGPGDYRGVSAKRTAGYYGNSHIFQGGDNLRDPHAAGDEHHHFIGRQAAARGVEAHKKAYQAAIQPVIIHTPDEGEPHVDNVPAGGAAADKSLKSATLAEQARIQQLQAEQRIIEGIRRVDKDGEMEALPIKHVEHAAADGDAAIAGKQKRPIMPFDKLVEKKKPAAAISIPQQKEVPSTPELDTVDLGAGTAQIPLGGGNVIEESIIGNAKEFEMTDREQIADLRKKAAARRLAKKAAAEGAAKAEAGDAKPEVAKAERPGARLGLVAKKKRAQIQQEEGSKDERQLEAATILSDPM